MSITLRSFLSIETGCCYYIFMINNYILSQGDLINNYIRMGEEISLLHLDFLYRIPNPLLFFWYSCLFISPNFSLSQSCFIDSYVVLKAAVSYIYSKIELPFVSQAVFMLYPARLSYSISKCEVYRHRVFKAKQSNYSVCIFKLKNDTVHRA